ncbi:MAG: ABC transporter substrate-binding protein [Oscillospiraceae bacterium]|nr:ABC transporter substrate-binding protein [Oscillospiraceae bacterium]
MLKRIVCLLFAAVMVFSVMPHTAPEAQAKADSINVYNWGVYISDGSDGLMDVNAAFTEATGIEVNYATFDSNESLYTKLKTGGSSYDVIIPSDYMIARLIEEEMLLPINFDNIPNYANVGESYKNTAYDPENKYPVPYTWGTVGIIYNSAYVPEVTGWDALWNGDYADKILMFDNPRDAFAAALLKLGYDINTTDPDELKAAADILADQRPLVQSYVMDQVFAQMERSEAWLAPYYAGDFLTMKEENPDLEFCFPEEGFNLYIDAMCIPTSCQNKEGAEAYINFLCSYDVALANAMYTCYGSPINGVKEGLELSPEEEAVSYPSEETLKKGYAFGALPIETNQLMDSLWLEVKTAADDTVFYTVATLTVIVVAIALLVIRNVKQKKRAARRRAARQGQ